MESNANYALVGFVSVLVLVLAGAFVYWFALLDNNVATKQYDVVFTGTVTGLSPSTPVLFNGIRVGQVRTVAIDPNDPGRVIARIEVDTDAPVKADTKAILEFQGLTGVAFVQLTGGTPGAADLLPGNEQQVAVIIADKSDFQSILDGVQNTIVGASVAFDRLNKFLDDNEATTASTLANVEAFSAALAANSDGVEEFLASISDAGAEIGPLAGELRLLSTQIRGLVGDVKPGQVAKIVDDVSTFTDAVARNSENVDVFFADAVALSASLTKSSAEIEAITARIGSATEGVDPETIAEFVDSLGAISKVLDDNAGNVDAFLGNMTDVSVTLAQSIDQVRSIVDAIDDMANSAGSEGLFEQLSSAATAIQVLAENLDSRTAVLATGLNRFTSGGLSEYQALAVEARSTLRRLESLISTLNRNPQGLIFGGDTVREYNKR